MIHWTRGHVRLLCVVVGKLARKQAIVQCVEDAGVIDEIFHFKLSIW